MARAYGHTLGAAVALGYVKNPEGLTVDYVRSGKYEINVSGKRVSATAHLRAPYDPERRRILG